VSSRYDGVEVAEARVPDGTGGVLTVRYLRRRPPPAEPTLPPLARHRVVAGDRPDLIAARYLGDPLAWWRIADANRVLDPADLTEHPGDVVIVPTPEL
jgi:nucleoid-associated protein YgaU